MPPTPILAVKYKILMAVVPAIVAIDQITKLKIVESFTLGESFNVLPGLFSLTYVRNNGAAFGILAQSHPEFRIPFFLAVPVIALAVIAHLFRKLGPQDRKLAFALSLVIGGALGNFIDRARLTFVVDFLDFYWGVNHFPAFNVADSAICVGVALLMLDLAFQKDGQPKKGQPKKGQYDASTPV